METSFLACNKYEFTEMLSQSREVHLEDLQISLWAKARIQIFWGEYTYSSQQDKSEKLVTATTNWRFLLLFFFSESKRPSGRGQNNEGPGPVSRRQSGLPELLFANRWAHHRMQWLFCSTHEAEGEEVGSTEQLLPPW